MRDGLPRGKNPGLRSAPSGLRLPLNRQKQCERLLHRALEVLAIALVLAWSCGIRPNRIGQPGDGR